MRAVFLDRDGTINVGVPKYERVDGIEKVELLPHTIEALTLLATLDFGIFIITNQAGIAEGLITLDEFEAINNKVLELIESSGIIILETYLCPHDEHDNCICRKPQPTLLLEAAAQYDIDLAESYMVGDRPTDVQTGINAGTKTILVQTGVPDVVAPGATHVAPDLLAAVHLL